MIAIHHWLIGILCDINLKTLFRLASESVDGIVDEKLMRSDFSIIKGGIWHG